MPAAWIAEHFALAEKAVGWSVRLGHTAEKVIGVGGVKSLSDAAENLTGATLPKWNCHIPNVDSKASRIWKQNKRLPSLDSEVIAICPNPIRGFSTCVL